MSESLESVQEHSLANFNPANPKLFIEEKILPYFEQMRAHDPVHYCADSPYGPYWSVTRYRDIMEVDKEYRNFNRDVRPAGGVSKWLGCLLPTTSTPHKISVALFVGLIMS